MVRKLRRANGLAGQGMNREQVVAGLGVSRATLYNWRRAPLDNGYIGSFSNRPRAECLRDQLNPDQNNPALKPGRLSIGDSPLLAAT